jgi:tetratricopeptide (TPR) repeat protein
MKLVVDELVALHEKMLAGDPYELLGVGPDASIEEVKKRHRKLASRFNPEILSSQLPEDLAAMAHALSKGMVEARDQMTQPRSNKSTAPAPENETEKAAAAAQEEEMARRFKMGKVLLNQRQYAQAREHFEFCMERDRYSGLYRAYYGWAIYSDPSERESGGAERAYEVIREASLLDQNEPIIQVYFGQLLRERGELAHAATVLRRVLRSEPTNAAARRELNAIKAQDPSIRIEGTEQESSEKAKKGLFGR